MRVKHVAAGEYRDFGNYIKAIRQSLGLTQAMFSEELGITAKTLITWERGITAPTVDFANEIVDKLGGKIIFEVPKDLSFFPFGRNDWQE